MIRRAAAILLVLVAGPAAADSCSVMLLKDDLPNCVKQLDSKIFILQAQLQAEQSRNRLNSLLLCSLALSLNKVAPAADVAATAENACAGAKEASSKPAQQKSKTAHQ
jgi:hypothetical protein